MTMESTGAVDAGTPAPSATAADAPTADAEKQETSRTGEGGQTAVRPEAARQGAAAPACRHVPRRQAGGSRGRALIAALLAADCLAAATAALAAGGQRTPVPALVPALLILVALHRQGGLYHQAPSCNPLGRLPGLFWRAALAWSAAATVVGTVRPDLAVSLTRLLCLIALHVALAALLRTAVHHLRRGRQRRNPRSTLVVGAGPAARRVAAVLHDHLEYGMRPVGLVAPQGGSAGSESLRAEHGGVPEAGLPALPVLTAAEDVTRAVIQNSVSDAVLTRSPQADPETTALVRHFRAHGCTVWVVDSETAPGDTVWKAAASGHVWGFPCARLDPPPRRPAARAAKRALDVAVAVLALLAAAPVLALCALAVRISDGPGVLFRQERVGVYGRPFVMLKFRTLRPTDEKESATRWTVAHDRRMSAVGSLLRRTSLDELPQLWNVLRGDMSLVGPRPERPYFVQQFSTAHPGYAARVRMPAGITGLAQVHGLRGDTSIEDRARFDNHYIESWSFWQDVQILLRTAGAVFRLKGS